MQISLIKEIGLYFLYNGFMNNLKEENIRRAIWHIKRHLEGLRNSRDEENSKYEMFYLQSSVECLERVINDKNPYPFIDREDVF